jgi:hypothetical protein
MRALISPRQRASMQVYICRGHPDSTEDRTALSLAVPAALKQMWRSANQFDNATAQLENAQNSHSSTGQGS